MRNKKMCLGIPHGYNQPTQNMKITRQMTQFFRGKKDGQLVIKTKYRPCLNKPTIKQTGNLNTKLDVKVKRLPDLELIIVFGADGYSSP